MSALGINDAERAESQSASDDALSVENVSVGTEMLASTGVVEDIAVPEKVAEVARGDAIEVVWRNELGGVTFRLHGDQRDRYVKWQCCAGLTPDQLDDVNLLVEAEKMQWAGKFIRAPRVLDYGVEGDIAWLVTEEIPAFSAVHPRWRDQPETAVRAIARGLRRLHDALPIEDCPYSGTWMGSKAFLVPEPEQLVVCHGDPCVPNTLMKDSGEFSGHVDFARLGIADRWADLAIATYSISWDINFGRGYDELFFETYGVEPDDERIRIYRDLWDAD